MMQAVHAIVGDRAFDSFLAEEALEALLAEAVGKERADAVEAFRGEEATWARVFDAARTRSLFAAQRAVVVRDADALKGEPDGLDAFRAIRRPGWCWCCWPPSRTGGAPSGRSCWSAPGW